MARIRSARPRRCWLRCGAVGEIVQVGHHVEANVPVYLVEFPGSVVGCIEEEIVPAWGP